MTTFALIRHARHEFGDERLAGRLPGVTLGAEGRAQAAAVAANLGDVAIEAVYSSPLERARQTAEAIASARGLPVRVRDELNELDFGEWTGRSITALRREPRWVRFNAFRSGTRAPAGELMIEAQARAVSLLEALAQQHGRSFVVLVSHADVIRAALLHYLAVPLDLFLRLAIGHASVSLLEIGDAGPRVLCVNHRGAAFAGGGFAGGVP